MPNLIDVKFFVGEINIPNTTKLEVEESLNVFISKYEKQLLKQMLGYELWKSYNDDNTTPRFVDLIDGKDEWQGLVYDITDTVQGSLIANYVYCYWLRDKQIWNSGLGTVRPKPDSAEIMPLYMKYMEAWNSCSEQIWDFVKYMEASSDVYPEWKPVDLWMLRSVNDFDL